MPNGQVIMFTLFGSVTWPTFVSALKGRYQIPFCSLGNGISYLTWQSNTFLQLVKESLIALRAITKGNLTPFRANCMRDPGICKQCR
jgi:hypothetical protein